MKTYGTFGKWHFELVESKYSKNCLFNFTLEAATTIIEDNGVWTKGRSWGNPASSPPTLSGLPVHRGCFPSLCPCSVPPPQAGRSCSLSTCLHRALTGCSAVVCGRAGGKQGWGALWEERHTENGWRKSSSFHKEKQTLKCFFLFNTHRHSERQTDTPHMCACACRGQERALHPLSWNYRLQVATWRSAGNWTQSPGREASTVNNWAISTPPANVKIQWPKHN